MTSSLLIVLLATLPAQSAPPLEGPEAGSISGVVVNASQDGQVVAYAEVALRVMVDGQFVVAGETTTDGQGRFRFGDIPADPEYVYLAGANWQTVHYPGERLQLSGSQRDASIQLSVHDALQSPSPLVVRRHEITIEREGESLQVTEALLVDNPTQTTFVGQPKKDDGRAATLTLSVPSDFARTTFHEEFFGRRFALIDGQLVTDVPWTPGEREVKFTYVLPDPHGDRVWERVLDLPTSDIQVRAKSKDAHCLTASLQAAEPTEPGTVTFAADSLPAGHVLQIDLQRAPQSFAIDPRWLALAVLAAAIVASVFSAKRTARKPETGTPSAQETLRRAA